MEPKEFDFEFPRGDTLPFTWEMTDANAQMLEMTPEKCELTFTARDASKNIVIQKFYSKGEIEVVGIKASLFFKHEDTMNLKINGTYEYDVQFNSGDYYKTMILGKIKLTKELTY